MELILNQPRYCNNDDRICVQLLLKEVLQHGCTVSVWEGEDWAIEKSDDFDQCLEALSSSGEDVVYVRDDMGIQLGWFYLIYDNGSENDPIICISDYSDTAFCQSVYESISKTLEV